jgi:membrane protein implicated in regulation of membrane protease activity
MCAYWNYKKEVLGFIILLCGVPLVGLFVAISLPLLYNHPVRFAGTLFIILAILVIYFFKRTGKHNDKKP